MAIVTIPKKVTGKEELVIISKKELDRLKAQIVPSFFLKRKAADKLDKRVAQNLKEHHAGKTERVETFLRREHSGLYPKYAG